VTDGGDAGALPYRVLVSPATGTVLLPDEDERPRPGEFLLPGDAVAVVRPRRGAGLAVCSPFRGWTVGYVVRNGQPVETGDPIAWLRGVDW
jgi:hypothetical protein